MATIPIPTIARGFNRRVNGAAPLMQGVGQGGTQDLAQGLMSASDSLARGREREQREVERRLEQDDMVEREQQKARNLERVSQVRLEWTESLMRRKTEAPEGAEGFTPGVLKDFDTNRNKLLDGVKDERERQMLDGLLTPVREHLGTDALGFEVSARRAYRKRVLGEATEQDAKTVTLSPEQFRDVLAQRLSAIASSRDLDVESKAALIEQARETLALQAGLSLIDRPGGPEDFLARTGVAGGKAGKGGKLVTAPALAPGLADPVIGALSDKGLRTLIDRATTMKVQRDTLAAAEAERRVRLAEIAANKRDREATQAWTLLGGFVRDGLAPDMTDPVNVKAVQALAGTPLEGAYRQGLESVAKRGAAALQPIAVQREQLAALRVQAEQKGTSKALQDEIEFRQKAAAAAESAFQRDPLRAFGERFPQARPQPLDTTNSEALLAGLRNRTPLVDAARQFGAGLPVRVSHVLDDEAPAVKALIDRQPEKERSALIAGITRAVGPQGAAAIAEQLGKGGEKQARVLELQFKAGAAATMAGQYRGEFIARGARALDDKSVLKDSVAISGWEALIAAEVDKLRLPSATDAKDMKDSAGYIVAALAAEKNGAAGQDQIKRAVQIAAGGTVVEQGGGHIVLPDGVTHNQLTQTLRAVTPQTLLTARRTGNGTELVPFNAAEEWVRVDGAHIPVQAFLQSLPGARLTTMRHGLYGVLVGPPPGRYVTTNDGAPIIIAGPQ